MSSEQFYLGWQKRLTSQKNLRKLLIFFAIYSILFFVAVTLYLCVAGGLKVAVLSGLAFVLARFIFSPLIYALYKKQRPYQKFKFDAPYSWLLSSHTLKFNAFPSDHALSFLSIVTVMAFYYPALAAAILILGVLNSWARVALGYHDVIDILGGWVVGIVSGLIIIHWVAPLVLK